MGNGYTARSLIIDDLPSRFREGRFLLRNRAPTEGSTPLRARLIELAEEAGFEVTSPRDPAQRGGTITIAAPHAPAVTRELIRREIIVDYRPGAGVRVSPHFYTKDEELERVVREMRQIVDTRAYAAHEAAGAAF